MYSLSPHWQFVTACRPMVLPTLQVFTLTKQKHVTELQQDSSNQTDSGTEKRADVK
jgi:hypothetical protein